MWQEMQVGSRRRAADDAAPRICRIVTLQADVAAAGPQFRAVRLVAIAAGDAGGEHAALPEGADNCRPRRASARRPRYRPRSSGATSWVLRQRGARHPILAMLPRRAWQRPQVSTSFAASPGALAPGGPVCGSSDQATSPPSTHQQARGSLALRSATPLLRARPGDMSRARAVAGLAADVDLRPGRGEAVRRGIVVLAQPGRMALGAHEIPVLLQPVQCSGRRARSARWDRGGTSAGRLVLRPRFPGDRQCLQAAVGKLDQILLQRVEAEGVLDLEGGGLAVWPVGLDEELPSRRKKRDLRRRDARK